MKPQRSPTQAARPRHHAPPASRTTPETPPPTARRRPTAQASKSKSFVGRYVVPAHARNIIAPFTIKCSAWRDSLKVYDYGRAQGRLLPIVQHVRVGCSARCPQSRSSPPWLRCQRGSSVVIVYNLRPSKSLLTEGAANLPLHSSSCLSLRP